MEKKKGSGMLKFSSVLLFISGILGILGTLSIGLFTYIEIADRAISTLPELAERVTNNAILREFTLAVLIVLLITTLIGTIFSFVAAAKGFKAAKGAIAPGICKTIGIILLVLAVVDAVIMFTNSPFSWNTALSALIGLVVPGLYLGGAVQLQQQQ